MGVDSIRNNIWDDLRTDPVVKGIHSRQDFNLQSASYKNKDQKKVLTIDTGPRAPLWG